MKSVMVNRILRDVLVAGVFVAALHFGGGKAHAQDQICLPFIGCLTIGKPTGPSNLVPELDPSAGASALTLVAAGAAVLAGRRKKSV